MLTLENIGTLGGGNVKIDGLVYAKGRVSLQRVSDEIFNVLRDGHVLNNLVPIDKVQLEDGTTFSTVTELFDWASTNFYCGTYTEPTVDEPADPPTSGVVDDTANTFSFTANPLYTSASDYQKTLNGGTTVTAAGSASSINVGDVAKATGQVGVRVKAGPGRLASAWLFNASPFTVSGGGGGGPITGYFLQEDDNSTPTEGEILAGTSFTIGTHNGNYSVTIPNIGLKFQKIAEPLTETAKTVTNDGGGDVAINGENQIGTIVTVGAFRVYIANYTGAYDAPLQMKVS